MAQAAAGHHATFGELVPTKVSCWGKGRKELGSGLGMGDRNCSPILNPGDPDRRIPWKWPQAHYT